MVFNRPDPTKTVFEAIRQAKPPRLYIASDGPRQGKQGEAEKVKQVRDYVLANIDWDCEVKVLLREENLGCKLAVDGAVKWFFSLESKGIVLEDDCLPSLRFFHFCEEMLGKFENNPKIAAICGRNELDTFKLDNGYFFTRKFFAWGWASWASRIKHADADKGLSDLNFNYKKNLSFLESLLVKSYVTTLQSGAINSWDWPYDLSFRERDMLTVLPAKNLVRNIGFGEDATHTKTAATDEVPWHHDLTVDLSRKIKIKPSDRFIKKFIKKNHKNTFTLFVSANLNTLRPWINLYKVVVRR